MAQYNIYFNQKEDRVVQELIKDMGVDNGYTAIKKLVLNHTDQAENSLGTIVEDVQKMSYYDLEKEFNKLADADKDSLKKKKNAAWLPERFYNDMYDLYAHKAPIIEFIVMAQHYYVMSVIVNELMKRKGYHGDFVDFNEIHMKAARLRSDPGGDYLMNKFKDKHRGF